MKYESLYGKGQCTAAQYIGELMCQRRAASLKRDLPSQFWEFKEWRNFLVYQITLANKLLKVYNEECVFSGLRDVKWAYSLKTKKLIDAIIAHQLKYCPKSAASQKEKEVETFGRKAKENKLTKLRQLEND